MTKLALILIYLDKKNEFAEYYIQLD